MTQQNLLAGLIIAIVALVIVAAGIMVVIAPGATEPAPGETIPASKAPVPDGTKALAVEIAGEIDGDAHAALKPGDENTPAFTAIRDRLKAFRDANPGVLYAYTMRNVGNVTEYVVDADYGSDNYAFAIGDDYSHADEDTALRAGFTEPSVGTYTTVYGYAPIKNSGGAGAGMVCLYIKGPIAQENLETLAAEIAGEIDGDAHAALRPGDENTPAFIAIRDRLDAFRAANPDIAYIYTMRKAGNATEYVVDADYGSGNDSVAIGVDYTPQDSDTAFFDGFEKPSAAMYLAVSGYAPIKDSTGAVVGLVGVDTESMVTGESMKALAAEAAARIDGDALAALRPGDEKTPAYTAIRDQLEAVRAATPGVVYIYTMRKTATATEYVVDADYGSGDGAAMGYVYVPTEEDIAFLAGFAEPSAEPGFYVEEWGNDTATLITGYAPVRDSAGTVVGLVGVDMGRVW